MIIICDQVKLSGTGFPDFFSCISARVKPDQSHFARALQEQPWWWYYDIGITHCTLHTVHYTLHTVHCTLHSNWRSITLCKSPPRTSDDDDYYLLLSWCWWARHSNVTLIITAIVIISTQERKFENLNSINPLNHDADVSLDSETTSKTNTKTMFTIKKLKIVVSGQFLTLLIFSGIFSGNPSLSQEILCIIRFAFWLPITLTDPDPFEFCSSLSDTFCKIVGGLLQNCQRPFAKLSEAFCKIVGGLLQNCRTPFAIFAMAILQLGGTIQRETCDNWG